MTRYVVYEQDLNSIAGFINTVYGPFNSWETANKFCSKLQETTPDSWYGIRQLIPQSATK